MLTAETIYMVLVPMFITLGLSVLPNHQSICILPVAVLFVVTDKAASLSHQFSSINLGKISQQY